MAERAFLNGRVTLHAGDCLDVLPTLAENSVDSVVTDPPYGLEFMGKHWDSFKTYAGGNPNMKPQGQTIRVGRNGAVSYGYRQKNPRCRRCGKLSRGNGSCKCPEPQWDTRTSESAFQFQCFCEDWAHELLRVMKPGAHLLAFGAPKNFHRLVCAIEDGGFEVRDCVQWLFGSGFPKSHDVSKAIDRTHGAEREVEGFKRAGISARARNGGDMVGGVADEAQKRVAITTPATDAGRQWEGWGTALKPAYEPIILARKPLSEATIATNVLRWGTGALNIDSSRVGTDGGTAGAGAGAIVFSDGLNGTFGKPVQGLGRWPANVIHDGSEEVVSAFPETGTKKPERTAVRGGSSWHGRDGLGSPDKEGTWPADSGGSAARFFFSAKADSDDRLGSRHPTVKPLDLMQYLVRLITPPKGVILDPFAGTGTTAEAAWREGFSAILIERETEYVADIERRMALCLAGPDERARESMKARLKDKPVDAGPLFEVM